MKDLLIQRMDESEEEQLAHKLGISYDELMELNHQIDTEESEDGVVYNYIISFDSQAPREILQKIKGINKDHTVWLSPWEYEGDYYYEEQYRSIASNKNFFESFLQAMSAAEKLNHLNPGAQLASILKRQIYVSVIAALEAFLSETFVHLTMENKDYFRNFIETFPDFKERKFELSRIFVEQDRLTDTAKKIMVEVIYHNLAKVRNMYQSTFKIEFPDIAAMSKCVSIRHDLVHRNGKTKDNKSISIDNAVITELIKNVSYFAEDIAKKLKLPRKKEI